VLAYGAPIQERAVSLAEFEKGLVGHCGGVDTIFTCGISRSLGIIDTEETT